MHSTPPTYTPIHFTDIYSQERFTSRSRTSILHGILVPPFTPSSIARSRGDPNSINFAQVLRPSFEPALRIWHAANTYEHYLTFALHTRPSESQLRSLEQAMIATYHPSAQRPLRVHPSPEARSTDRGPDSHDLHGKHFRQPTTTYASPIHPLPRLARATR